MPAGFSTRRIHRTRPAGAHLTVGLRGRNRFRRQRGFVLGTVVISRAAEATSKRECRETSSLNRV